MHCPDKKLWLLTNIKKYNCFPVIYLPHKRKSVNNLPRNVQIKSVVAILNIKLRRIVLEWASTFKSMILHLYNSSSTMHGVANWPFFVRFAIRYTIIKWKKSTSICRDSNPGRQLISWTPYQLLHGASDNWLCINKALKYA